MENKLVRVERERESYKERGNKDKLETAKDKIEWLKIKWLSWTEVLV